MKSMLNHEVNRRDLMKTAAVAGVATTALAANGAFAQSATPEASPVATVSVGDWSGKTLRLNISVAEAERPAFNDIVVKTFTDMTGGEIEITDVEAQDVVNTLTAQVESGNIEFDALLIDNNSLAALVDGGLVEEIPNAEELMPATTVEALKAVLTFDDTYYFLPGRPNVELTFYNSAKFDEYELETPKTWDDVKAVGQAFKDGEGIGKLCFQGAAGSPVGVTVTQFLWQAGADPLEINSDAGVEAFTFMQELKDLMTPQYQTAKFDTINTYMLDESVYFMQNWPFGVNVIVKDGGKSEVMTYAGFEGPAGNALVLGGDVLGVAKGSPNKDMALDFFKVLSMTSVQEQLTAALGWPSILTDANGSVEDWQKPYFDTITEALGVTKPRPNVPYWPDVENILTNAFNDIVAGGADVKSTLDRYQGEIDALKG